MIRSATRQQPIASKPRTPERPDGVSITVRPGDSFYSMLQREGKAITGRELSPLELTICAQYLDRTSFQAVEPGRQVTISAADLEPVLSKIQHDVASGLSSFEIGRHVNADLYGPRASAGRQYLTGVRAYEVNPGESVAGIAHDVASTFSSDLRKGWTNEQVLQLAAALTNGVVIDGQRVSLFDEGERLQAGEVVQLHDVDLSRVAEVIGLPVYW